METRFVKTERAPVATRLCGRNEVNPALSFDEAVDAEHFGGLLCAMFGAPDDDASFAIPVRDLETGVVFEAQITDEGPGYWAEDRAVYEDALAGDLRLKPEVLRTLRDFDAWLETSTS